MTLLVGIASFFLFLLFQSWGIYAGDSGDIVTAGYLFGVPHPPGYPLYTLLTFLMTRIPVATVAFRATLLSSIFHAATVAVVFAFAAGLTKRWWAGLFAALLLAGNYVFFLYGVTPEVFALFDFFLITIAYLTWQWIAHPRPATLAALAFVAGLSLSHHHLILFLFPGLCFVLWQRRRQIVFRARNVLLFLLGLIPYAYIPIAARSGAIINWDSASDLPGFVRLITRADYGTFRSGAVFGEGLAERWVQVVAYARFILLDFGWVGVALALAGVWYLVRKHRLFAQFLLLSLLFLGPAYFFYASFPLVNRFMLGTYERFLLPSYVFLALLAGIGVAQVAGFIRKTFLAHAVAAVLFILPIAMLSITLYRFWGLPADRTAERLGQDVLASLPAEGASILLLARDTPLFTTQYVRYVLGERQDVPAIAFGQLGDSRYRRLVSQNFPAVTMPQEEEDFFSHFFQGNAGVRRIFTNAEIPLPQGWVLVPYGLVFEVVQKANAPEADVLRQTNRVLWDGYQQPGDGILGRYNHLMLSDVRDVYAAARLALGKVFLRADHVAWAADEFRQAVALEGDSTSADAYTYLGLSELWLENCDAAFAAFAKAREYEFVTTPELSLYESVTQKDCVGDAARAQELFEQYERERQAADIPLGSL